MSQIHIPQATLPPAQQGDFKPAPAGMHYAWLYMMVDLGWHITEFEGKKRQQAKVYLRWEYMNEFVEITRNGVKSKESVIIGEEFTYSLSDKSHLYNKIYVPFMGRSLTPMEQNGVNFNPFEPIFGQACVLNVVHAQGKNNPNKTYAKVMSMNPIQRLPSGEFPQLPPMRNKLLYFVENDISYFADLPEFIQRKIQQALPLAPNGAPLTPQQAAEKTAKGIWGQVPANWSPQQEEQQYMASNQRQPQQGYQQNYNQQQDPRHIPNVMPNIPAGHPAAPSQQQGAAYDPSSGYDFDDDLPF